MNNITYRSRLERHENELKELYMDLYGNELKALGEKRLRKSRGVLDYLLCVSLELGLQSLQFLFLLVRQFC